MGSTNISDARKEGKIRRRREINPAIVNKVKEVTVGTIGETEANDRLVGAAGEWLASRR